MFRVCLLIRPAAELVVPRSHEAVQLDQQDQVDRVTGSLADPAMVRGRAFQVLVEGE